MPVRKRVTDGPYVALSALKGAADIFLFVDNSRKSATCTVCKQKIVGGSDRANFQYRLPYSRRLRANTVSTVKAYAHIDCIVDFLQNGTKFVRRDSCIDCGGSVDTKEAYVRSINGHVCQKCSESGRWQFCSSCSHYSPKYRMSIAAKVEENAWLLNRPRTPGVYSGKHYVCDSCVVSYGIVSVRQQNRSLKKERQIEKKYREIREMGGVLRG